MLLSLKVITKKAILFLHYTITRIKACFSRVNKEEILVLLDLDGLRVNRRIVQVALQLKNAGYQVFYSMPAFLYIESLFNGWDDYQNLFFENTSFYKPTRNKYDVVFCGRKNINKYKKGIVFFDNIAEFKNTYTSSFFYPILFHPVYLAKNIEEELLNSTKNNRIGILFIGSNAETYNAHIEELHRIYGVESRCEVLNYICDNFENYIVRPESKEQLFSLLNDEDLPLKNKIVIIDRFRVNGDDYWTVLKCAAFHLWTSGYIQPYCHNQVESMCCGAIPICNCNIKYQGVDETNSFQFTDLQELVGIVEKLLHLDINSEYVVNLNRLVKKNYHERIGNEAYRAKIDDFVRNERNEETYYICMGIYS